MNVLIEMVIAMDNLYFLKIIIIVKIPILPNEHTDLSSSSIKYYR